MAYATSAHISSEFKDITFSASTKVTDTEVDRFIEEADAEIDSVLSKRYVTPITGSVSLILIRQISIWLVAQRVKDILVVKTGVKGSDQGNLRNDDIRLDRKAKNMLQDIVNEKLDLVDATFLDSSGGVSSYNVDNNIGHVFDRESNQW